MAAFVVQSPSASQQTAQNPSQSFSAPIRSGNLLVLFFSWANTNGAIASVTDSLGNIWQQFDFQQVVGTVRTLYCWAALAKTGGPCTVTIATDSSRTYTFSLYEVNGATAILDGAPVHSNTSVANTTPATGTLATTFPGSVVFASTKCGTLVSDPPSPWVPNDRNNFSSVYQVSGNPPGSFSATWSCASNTWAATILAFLATMPPNTPSAPDRFAFPFNRK